MKWREKEFEIEHEEFVGVKVHVGFERGCEDLEDLEKRGSESEVVEEWIEFPEWIWKEETQEGVGGDWGPQKRVKRRMETKIRRRKWKGRKEGWRGKEKGHWKGEKR